MKFHLPTVLIFLLAALASAQAASIVVNSTADPAGFDANITVATLGSTVTLRDAVNAANNTGGTNTVAFNAPLAGGIIALGIDGDDTFGPSALLVSSALTIDGGAGGITITRDTTAQPTRLRLFYVNGAGNLTLKNLTVSGGKALGGSGNNGGGAAGLGGAIVNAGLLQLVQTTVTGNQAIGGSQNNNAGAGGGGLGSDSVGGQGSGVGGGPNGGNGGDGGFGGGGSGSGNTNAGGFGGGGGICLNFCGNGGFGGGGAFYGGSGGFGGGNGGRTQATRLGGGGAGLGGAIFNYGGTLKLINSTLAGNSAAPGTGGNNGGGLGGAIFNLNGTVNATFATIANNTAGEAGLYSLGDNGVGTQDGPVLPATAAVVTLDNTILAGSVNSAGGITHDYVQNTNNSGQIGNSATGSVLSSGANNIIQTPTTDQSKFGGSYAAVNPLLAPLASRGGPTQTEALVTGSPALDAGTTIAGITTDERGISRPQNGSPDIGAFEAVPSGPSIVSPNIGIVQAGAPANLAVVASGEPAPVFSATGTLPAGLTLSSTGIFTGTPATNSVGSYPLTITVTSSLGSAMQNFTLKVIVEAPSTVVTLLADTSDSTDGQTSLREAVAYAATLYGPQTITFAPSLAGKTFLLSTGWSGPDDESILVISSSLTLQGPATGPGITIAIAPGVQKRHAYVAPNGALTVRNLTFSGGYAVYFGGSIWSQGSLTVRNCTFTGNSVGQEGGAIQSWGDSPLLSIENSTFCGNTANFAASAIDMGAAQMTLRDVTITGNTTANGAGNAMVIYKYAATMVNTIIAGNNSDGVTSVNGGGFSAQSTNNLLGPGDTAGLAAVNGNQLGITAPRLGPLGNNGGPTATVPLIPGSPAIDAGTTIDGIIADQRGISRPQGSAPDIGAFEAILTLVTVTDDSGPGSLRQAIADANARGLPTTVEIDPSLAGQTINLTSFDSGLDTAGAGPAALRITGDIAIYGNGVTFSGSGGGRLFYIYNPSAPAAAHLALAGITLRGGSATGGAGSGGGGGMGGAIFNRQGRLDLTGCTITGNNANGGRAYFGFTGGGGGMGQDGAFPSGGGPNGGPGNDGSNHNGDNGGFGGGGAAGYYQSSGGGNGGFGGGGGYGAFQGSGGFGGGGGWPNGFSSVVSSGGFGGGGGSYFGGSGGGGAGMGGAIFNESGITTITNSTIAGNTTRGGTGSSSGSAVGGAIFTRNGSVTATYSTLAGNSGEGGGIYAAADGGNCVVLLNNCILSNTNGNDFNSASVNGGTRAFSGAGNLIQVNPTDGNGFAGSNTISADPHLGPLGDNGGLTQTMALLNGSPAIDAGIVNGITADQRGIARPQGSGPDIGAFEARQVRPVFATASFNDFPTDAPYDLMLASEPSPTGGVFSGIGVNSGIFSPAQAALGSNVISYAVVSLDNITTTASLVINLSLPPFSSWQMLQNLPADGSQDLANPSGDGVTNLVKYAFNLAPNAGDLATPNAIILPANGTAGLPAIRSDSNGRLVIDFVRRKASTYPGLAYVVQTCADVASWKELSLVGATVTPIDLTWERVSVTDPTITASRFGRVLIAEAPANYNAALGNPLRGSAVWQGSAVQLTQNVGGQAGAVVCNGISLSSAAKGFSASFNMTITTTHGPADGVNFAVGDLGSVAWGEKGPGTSHSLAIGFDTYGYLNDPNDPNNAAGIHLWVDGAQAGYAGVFPYTGGATVPVTISYDPVSGVSVTYNGAAIFTNVPISGFTLQSSDQFGLGARTGGLWESAVVDNLQIAPR